MVDFALWSMPVQYTSIIEEHQATRSAVGVFDISHMGRLTLHGAGAAAFLDRVVTRRIVDMPSGGIRYGLIANQQGGILDDVLVYHVPGVADSDYQMVVNASNREKIVAWLHQQVDAHGCEDVQLVDRTTETAMIAVQGPQSLRLMKSIVEADLSGARNYSGQMTRVAGRQAMVSRTGYTGEDGCELVVEAPDAETVWNAIFDAAIFEAGSTASNVPVVACGLGCRDTLRLEAGMPLYGHELTEQINPVQAGLGLACNLDGRDFIGRDAIEQFEADTSQLRRVGLQLEGRRVPREGYAVFAGDQRVGEVTSGTFSPTFTRPIAMAYVQAEAATPGTMLAVDIRSDRRPAKVVPLPFYRRAKS